jgi:hypothetical protein
MTRGKFFMAIAILGLTGLLMMAFQCGPATTPGPEVEDAVGAKDAALAYLREQKGQDVATADADWSCSDVTPYGLVGAATKELTTDGWTVRVFSTVVAPEYIVYTVTVTTLQGGWRWQGKVKPDGAVTELSPVTQMSQEGSRDIAEEFVRNSPTFTYDGMEETLKLTETLTARCPFCWTFTFEFDSRAAGYGDRTGQMLAQVITHHRAVIAVDKHEIISAVMDDKWDMLRQRELE